MFSKIKPTNLFSLKTIFWTFVLNAICKAGYKNLSWFLVLFPFLLLFIALGLLLLTGIPK